MTGKYVTSTAHMNHCSTMAAACSPARIIENLDTVVILAVSVFVCLISIRLRIPLM